MIGTHRVAYRYPKGSQRHPRMARCACWCAHATGVVCACSPAGVRTGVRMPYTHRCAYMNLCKLMTTKLIQVSGQPLSGRVLAPSLEILVRQPSQPSLVKPSQVRQTFFDRYSDCALSRAGNHGEKL